MLHHQAAVLHDFDAGLGKRFRGGGVADAGLEPDRFGFFRQNIFDVVIDVRRTAEDVDHVDAFRDIRQLPVNLFPENCRHVRGSRPEPE